MKTYEEFKKTNGITSIKWGNCKAKEKDGKTVQRAMAIVDGISFYSRAGLLTEKIKELNDKDLYVYSTIYEKTGEPVLWLTDKAGLSNIIEK